MNTEATAGPVPWNKGKLIVQKPPLKLQEIWTLRTRLPMAASIITPTTRARRLRSQAILA
jgi:hypothetical protein